MKERPVDLQRTVIAHNEPTKVAQPSERALDRPAPFVAPEDASILRRRAMAVRAMRCDQQDAPPPQPSAQCVAVIALVGDHPQRLPTGMQNKGGPPKEFRGRRPPPSTSSPCPAWFFRLPRPLFGRGETAVQKRLAPFQLLAFVQLAQERSPDVQPDALLVPVPQSSPAGRRVRIFLRHILPTSPAPQNPENPFQHPTVLDPRATALAVLARFGKQGRDFLPLRFGQQRTGSRHRPSFGAADSAYPAFRKKQPSSFQTFVSGYATASSTKIFFTFILFRGL